MFEMDRVNETSPVKKTLSRSENPQGKRFLTVYRLKYEEREVERDLQDIVITNVPMYVGKTLTHPFSVHCMLCNKTLSDEGGVYSHFIALKHTRQQECKKDAVGIISKEFNTFILGRISELIAFVHVYYKARSLNEIVVASRELIFSEKNNLFFDESDAFNRISLNSPAFVQPTVEDAYFRVVVHKEDTKLYPKIAYVYELLTEGVPSSGPLFVDIPSWCIENIPNSTFVWCTPCCRSLSMQTLGNHLSNERHTLTQNPFLYGFMCHKCETFFLIVHGHKLNHVHTRGANQKFLRKQMNKKFNTVHLLPDISINAINFYINNFMERYMVAKSEFKFECLICSTSLLRSYNEFSAHLCESAHKDKIAREGRKFSVYCSACNIVLIAQHANGLLDHLEVHESPLEIIRNNDLSPISTDTVSQSVTSESGSSGNQYSIAETTILYPKVANFSETAFQITNPGIQDDFTITRDFTTDNIEEYIRETYYSIYSDIKKMYYICLNCTNYRMEKNSFYEHLRTRKHQMKVRNFANLIFYVKICDICQVFLLGSHINLLQKHFISKEHNQSVKYRMNFIKRLYAEKTAEVKLGWSGEITERCQELFSSENVLNQCVESSLKEAQYLRKVSPLLEGILERDIKKTLEPNYGRLGIKFFGPRIYGLAQSKSDYDICLNLGMVSLLDLEQEFSKCTSLFRVKETVNEGRIPLIKLEHMYTSSDCAVCCDSAIVYNSELIKIYISLDYRTHWVLMAVREWATANHIRGNHKFTTHNLVWLVLFFMMQPDICLIPPVKLLKELHSGPKRHINGWNYSFSSDVELIRLHHNPSTCTKTKFEILYLFFQFYGMLKSEDVALFPLTGEVVPRTALLSADSYFCPEMFLNAQDQEPFRIDCQYVLLDPFRLKENILQNVEENLADHFRLICTKTFEESSMRL